MLFINSVILESTPFKSTFALSLIVDLTVSYPNLSNSFEYVSIVDSTILL